MKISSIFSPVNRLVQIDFWIYGRYKFFDTYLANFPETEQNVISDLATDNMKKLGSLLIPLAQFWVMNALFSYPFLIHNNI